MKPFVQSPKRQAAALIGMVVLCCGVMLWMDGVVRPGYAVKSAAKGVLFLLCPLLYRHLDREVHPLRWFHPGKTRFLPTAGLGVGVFTVILAAYFLLRTVWDFTVITGVLQENMGITGGNFIFVALYISFFNSLLEEFFFRGFAFFTLRRLVGRKIAYCFSALAFALYHTAMMLGWFSPALFLLALTGLFVGGLLFDFLNEQSGTILPSWAVHLSANLAINTVGFILFGAL